MMTPMRRILPWVWTAVIGVLALASGITEYNRAGGTRDAALGVAVLVPLIAITALGSVLSARQPGNRIAWVLHTISLVLLATLWSYPLVEGGRPESPDFPVYVAVIVQNAVAPIMLYAVFLLLFLFPTGRFMEPRWKWAWSWWVGSAFFALLLFIAVFRREVGPDYVEVPWLLDNPIGFLPTGSMGIMAGIMPLLLLAVAVGGITSTVIRFRRSDLVIRTQIKWVLLAGFMSALALPIGVADIGLVSDVLMMLAITAIPLAVTVAITRFRLFDIDRFISRSISYAIVVTVLGAVYAIGAVWVPARLVRADSPVLVALSTLAVAVLFNPLRRLVQRAVDRRFNRSSYEAEAVAREFADRLQGTDTAHRSAITWVETVNEHFEPSTIGVWITGYDVDLGNR